MPNAVSRRFFLRGAAAAPLPAAGWKSGRPVAYLEELSRLMRAAPVPGAAIGVLHSHRLSWIAPLGVRAEGSGDRVTASTLFHAASLTKQVVAHAAFILRDQGKLDFDRPLAAYLDGLRNLAARTVTARHVLSHSSGFPNWRSAGPSEPAPDLAPAFPPGSRYRYSGEGFFYLQRVLEQVGGTGIGRIVSELVFEPLGMTSTTLIWDPGTLDRTALPHDRQGEIRTGWDSGARALRAHAARVGKPVNVLRYEEYAAALRRTLPNGIIPNAASSLVTSAEDYARFVAAAVRNPELDRQQVKINESLGWGLGWAIERTAGRTYLWQWGDNPGFKNFVLAEPSTGNAVFVFTNGDSGARVYDRAVTHITGHDHPALFWL